MILILSSFNIFVHISFSSWAWIKPCMTAGTMFSNYRFILTTHSDIFLWHASSCVTTHRSMSLEIFSSLSLNIFSQTAKKRLGEEDNVSSVFQTHTWIAQVAIWAFWLITEGKCKTIYFLRFLFQNIISTLRSMSEGSSMDLFVASTILLIDSAEKESQYQDNVGCKSSLLNQSTSLHPWY